MTVIIQGFHLGLWPNLNPLLILSQVDIVLSGRLLCSLPPTVCIIVCSVVCQVAMLPSSNSFSIVYSALYFLPPVVLSAVCTVSSIVYSVLYYFPPTVCSMLYFLSPIMCSSIVYSLLYSFPPTVCSMLYFLPPITGSMSEKSVLKKTWGQVQFLPILFYFSAVFSNF